MLGCVSARICPASGVFGFPGVLSPILVCDRRLCRDITKFVMVDIKSRFTCGDLDLSEIIKKCKNIMTRDCSSVTD